MVLNWKLHCQDFTLVKMKAQIRDSLLSKYGKKLNGDEKVKWTYWWLAVETQQLQKNLWFEMHIG